MNLTCENCRAELLKSMGDVPSGWRDDIAAAICSTLEQSNKVDCEDVKNCETLTNLSDFYLDGQYICIRYTDEAGVTVERCFNVADLINESLNEVNPNCVATSSEWVDFTYIEKWQAIINRVCETCVEPPTTIPVTTVATTTQPPTTPYVPPTITPTTTQPPVVIPTTVAGPTTFAPTTQPPSTTEATTTSTSTTTSTTTQGVIRIEGIINSLTTGTSNNGGVVKTTISFFNPVPVAIGFEYGFDVTIFNSNNGQYQNISNGYPAPHTYTLNSPGCGGTDGIPKIIPVGATGMNDDSNCAEVSQTYAKVSKVVIFNTIIPAGYELVLTPARSDLAVEIR